MIDTLTIQIKGGDGGKGSISFRREKFVPKGGPDGGDGGKGGSVYLEGRRELNTLLHLRFVKRLEAERGYQGEGNNRKGRGGEDHWVGVPVGTQVYKIAGELKELLGDIVIPGQRMLVVRGGRGGRGNRRFVSPTNQEPLLAEVGEAGEEREVLLELKLLADVGIVGKPNAGKSTLLAQMTAATPKVAAYPFTTIEPVLGVVGVGEDSFVLVEIPGLLERAAEGVGLGATFLRHAERTRVLVHLLDGSSTDALADYHAVERELVLYSPPLAGKVKLVAVNKVDLAEVREKIPELASRLKEVLPEVCFLSAATGEGVEGLGKRLRALLGANLRPLAPEADKVPPVIEAPRRAPERRVRRGRKGEYLVVWPEAERLIPLAKLDDPRVRAQLWRELERLSVVRALEAQGVESGARVRIGEAELEWP